MANNNNVKDLDVKTLLKYMTFTASSKDDATKVDYTIGRFKFFLDLFKKNNSMLMTVNLLFMIFAVPLILVIMYLFSIGMERFSYIISSTEVPYFMANIGFGVSESSNLIEGQINMLYGYRMLFYGIAATLPFTFAGFAGLFHITNKLVWNEPLMSKKDSYGNDVPQVLKEFFVGVKQYGLKMLIIVVSLSVMTLAFSHLILSFIESLLNQSAGVVDWLGLIVSIVVSLIALMTLIQLCPLLIMYREVKFVDNLKNAFLLSIAMPIPTLFMALITMIPLLLFQIGGVFLTVVLIALIMFGVGFYSLAWTVYADYNSEKIIKPIYKALNRKPKKKAKEGKKK